MRGEGKQNCIQCDFAGRICSHYKPLSWGGSPYVQSRLGEGQSPSIVASVRAASEPDRKMASALRRASRFAC